jgi:hypothetical protein
MKSINRPCLSIARKRYFQLLPTLTQVSPTRQEPFRALGNHFGEITVAERVFVIPAHAQHQPTHSRMILTGNRRRLNTDIGKTTPQIEPIS